MYTVPIYTKYFNGVINGVGASIVQEHDHGCKKNHISFRLIDPVDDLGFLKRGFCSAKECKLARPEVESREKGP